VCLLALAQFQATQRLKTPTPTPYCVTTGGDWDASTNPRLESHCEGLDADTVTFRGVGIVTSKSGGKLLLHDVIILSSADVGAPGLTIDRTLTVRGSGRLYQSASADDAVFITGNTSLIVSVENKEFARIRFGNVGAEWKVVPKAFLIKFASGQDWSEEELRGFSFELITGTTIASCSEWVSLVTFEGDNKDEFKLECETSLDSQSRTQTIIRVKGVLPFWTLTMIIGVACGGLALLIIILVICGVCCCRSAPRKKGVDDAALEKKKAKEKKEKEEQEKKEKEKRDKEEKEEREKESKQKEKTAAVSKANGADSPPEVHLDL
jgi:hypothetical protein